ncbi:hypothetical protein SALBM311S_12346 [Streptomyces alboniger]
MGGSVDLSYSAGGGWENLALFDFQDRALPALRTLGRYRA